MNGCVATTQYVTYLLVDEQTNRPVTDAVVYVDIQDDKPGVIVGNPIGGWIGCEIYEPDSSGMVVIPIKLGHGDYIVNNYIYVVANGYVETNTHGAISEILSQTTMSSEIYSHREPIRAQLSNQNEPIRRWCNMLSIKARVCRCMMSMIVSGRGSYRMRATNNIEYMTRHTIDELNSTVKYLESDCVDNSREVFLSKIVGALEETQQEYAGYCEYRRQQ